MPSTILRTRHGSFDPLHPTPGGIHPRDIAAGLAGKYRWCGLSPIRSTVAQHSVEVSVRVAPDVKTARDLAAWGLLHDAAEAYLIDLPTPLKDVIRCAIEVPDAGSPTEEETKYAMVRWDTVEERILRAVAERFDLPWPIRDEVWEVDQRMRRTEYRDLWHDKADVQVNIGTDLPPYAEALDPRRWSPVQAEAHWLARFAAIFGEIL